MLRFLQVGWWVIISVAAVRCSTASRVSPQMPVRVDCPDMARLTSEVVALHATAAALDARLSVITAANDKRPVLQARSISGTFQTKPKNGGEGLNLDLAAKLPFDNIKRYTLTVLPGTLFEAPPGVDSIEVYTGVLSGGSTSDVLVYRVDPSQLGATSGFTVSPFVGSNAFIHVLRGSDGLGTVDLTFNVIIEYMP
jgi:hypothetical protein